MAVTKEWKCGCGKEFEALAGVCPRCGKEAHRAFRTPVGIAGGSRERGSARSIDAIVEAEFARQGISNFKSGGGGVNQVEYSSHYPGVYSSQVSGAPVQPAISAQFVRGGLANPQLRREVPFMVDGTPWEGPRDDAGVMAKVGAKVGKGLTPSEVREERDELA